MFKQKKSDVKWGITSKFSSVLPQYSQRNFYHKRINLDQFFIFWSRRIGASENLIEVGTVVDTLEVRNKSSWPCLNQNDRFLWEAASLQVCPVVTSRCHGQDVASRRPARELYLVLYSVVITGMQIIARLLSFRMPHHGSLYLSSQAC